MADLRVCSVCGGVEDGCTCDWSVPPEPYEQLKKRAESAEQALAEARAELARVKDELDAEKRAHAAHHSRENARAEEQHSKAAAFDAAVQKYGRWPPPAGAKLIDGRWEDP